MTEELVLKYSTYFQKLNRGFNKGLGRAPHKPILLLSIIHLFSKGLINTNRIFITTDLLLTFRQNWKILVDSNHTCNFSLPFFHLRSEPFWYLVAKPGKEIITTSSKSIKSFKNLSDTIAFAEIDRELFLLLQEQTNVIWLEQLLIETYFPHARIGYERPRFNYEEERIENEILNDPKEAYIHHLESLKVTLDEEEFEEEIFVRGGMFKKTIPKIYNLTCCVTGMHIQSSHNVQMIDACHIYPFSISQDDTVTNGIALSPTLHRAFDRGLITINSNFIVRVSPTINENGSNFTLSQFEGRQINLPEKEKWFPSIEALSWHNKEVFLL